MDLTWLPYACVINLDFRPDRLAAFESWAEPYGIIYDVLSAKRHKVSGLVGCWDSHLQVFRRALANGVPYAFVMEDDCIPSNRLSRRETMAFWAEVRASIEKLSGEWVLGLGGVPMQFTTGLRPNLSTHIYGAKFGENHAYIVSKAMMARMIGIPYEAPLDTMLPVYCDKMYLMSPELFIQDPNLGSDNSNIVQSIMPFRYTAKNVLHWILRKTPVGTSSVNVSLGLIAILMLSTLIALWAKSNLVIMSFGLLALVGINHIINVVHLNPIVTFRQKYCTARKSHQGP